LIANVFDEMDLEETIKIMVQGGQILKDCQVNQVINC